MHIAVFTTQLYVANYARRRDGSNSAEPAAAAGNSEPLFPLLGNVTRLGTVLRCVSSRLAEKGHAARECLGNVSIGSTALIRHADVSLYSDFDTIRTPEVVSRIGGDESQIVAVGAMHTARWLGRKFNLEGGVLRRRCVGFSRLMQPSWHAYAACCAQQDLAGESLKLPAKPIV